MQKMLEVHMQKVHMQKRFTGDLTESVVQSRHLPPKPDMQKVLEAHMQRHTCKENS